MFLKFRVVVDFKVICRINVPIKLVVFDAILAVEWEELSIQFYRCQR